MLSCGTDLWIQHSPSTNRYRVVGSRCGNRNCPICRVRWARSLREKLHQRFALMKAGRARLCTFTMKHTRAPLSVQIANLWKSLNRLRRRSPWKRFVSGCVAVIEITYNSEKDQWHPHLHTILDGLFFPHATLKKEWITASLGSSVVDIRPIRNTERTAEYMTKYLTKETSGRTSMPMNRQTELFQVWNDTRMVRTYGSLRHDSEESSPPDKGPDDWAYVAPFLDILEQAERGHTTARAILTALADCSRSAPSVDGS